MDLSSIFKGFALYLQAADGSALDAAASAAASAAVPAANVAGFDWDVALKVAPLLFSVFVFVYGALKVEKYLKIYKAKKLDATFNFYTNLDMLIRRLYLRISRYECPNPEGRADLKSGKPSPLVEYLWGEGRLEGLSGEISLLEGAVKDFLTFISTSREQIPPDVTEEGLAKWNRERSKLIISLNALMPKTPHESPGKNKYQLEAEHKELVGTLDYFMGKIEDAYKEYVVKANAKARITLNEQFLHIARGDSKDLAFAIDSKAATRAVKWKSNHPEVAAVDANGRLTAVSPGSATITAKAANRRIFIKSATCKVQVAGTGLPKDSV